MKEIIVNDWEPEHYTDNEIANALLNVAAAMNRQANATEHLLYALKYSRGEGLSVAEAIEVGANRIADGASRLAEAVEGLERQTDG